MNLEEQIDKGNRAAAMRGELTKYFEERTDYLVGVATAYYRGKDGIGFERALGFVAALNELRVLKESLDERVEEGEIAADTLTKFPKP